LSVSPRYSQNKNEIPAFELHPSLLDANMNASRCAFFANDMSSEEEAVEGEDDVRESADEGISTPGLVLRAKMALINAWLPTVSKST